MAQDQEAIAIDVDDAMVNSIKQKLQAFVNGERPSANLPFLFRVPDHVRESNKNHYEPRVVSIGPYHRGSKRLRAMEEHKWQYLRDFLARNPHIGLNHCIREMKALETWARRCYFESVDLSSDEFVEMMLLDGCFIIEFAIKFKYREGNALSNVSWGFPHIRSDLLMFENQIPFFILLRLFDLFFMGFDTKTTTPVCPPSSSADPPDSRDSEGKRPSLVELLREYLMRHRIEKPVTLHSHEIYHLLHLYHHCFISRKEPSDPDGESLRPLIPWINPSTMLSSVLSYLQHTTEGSLSTRYPRTIPCATKLQQAGVVFKKKTAVSWLDVTFENGVMEIPFLSIEDTTKSRFVNLVAFEQCYRGGAGDFTSYATFMDCIIDTGKDVAVLEQSGIIENKLATDEDAALFFNQLRECGYLDYDKHYLAGLFAKVNRYCESDWHKWRAKLMHDYFGNPWAILSLGAALVLLALTVAQTVFAAYQQFHPNKN
uniref:UPF0481 protein At3g47200-like n=1 Tax=Elaeis guineensis var. tenera TaxID=51953 RepID=A0A6I9R8J5_ELAGV|nr:UPF0481 protein At3g47200-like [Elaeis guineensis]